MNPTLESTNASLLAFRTSLSAAIAAFDSELFTVDQKDKLNDVEAKLQFLEMHARSNVNQIETREEYVKSTQLYSEEKNMEVKSLKSITETKDGHIASLEVLVKERDVEIGSLKSQIENLIRDKDSQIENLIRDKDSQIENLVSMISVMQTEASEMAGKFATLKARNEVLEEDKILKAKRIANLKEQEKKIKEQQKRIQEDLAKEGNV